MFSTYNRKPENLYLRFKGKYYYSDIKCLHFRIPYFFHETIDLARIK